MGAKVKTGLKILGPLLILHDGSGKITQAWKAKDTDKPQVAIEGGSEFVGATTGAMLGAAKGAALGAAIGTAVPIVGNFAGGIIGGILGGVAGYMGGGMAGRAAGEELANALGVKQDAYMPELMANADQLYKGLLAKGVPPDQALEAAKLFLGGRLGDFAKYMGQLRAKYGPKGGYVTSHHSQKDWYCTNRPEILAPVLLPPILQLMGMPPVPVPLPLPPAQGR
ncbi:MAG: hypothetical protein IPG66_02175 [Hydrogenophilales bacterium]|nr:hypothetical protein [Hydrogenophilales bacterium]